VRLCRVSLVIWCLPSLSIKTVAAVQLKIVTKVIRNLSAKDMGCHRSSMVRALPGNLKAVVSVLAGANSQFSGLVTRTTPIT
jgi:hypothetical protein